MCARSPKIWRRSASSCCRRRSSTRPCASAPRGCRASSRSCPVGSIPFRTRSRTSTEAVMRPGERVRCGLLILAGSLVLPLVGLSDAVADELDAIRSNYESALKTNEKRIQEIEARERGIADPQQRAEKITQDKVAALRNALKGDRTGKNLADAADKAASDPTVLPDLAKDSSKYLDTATSDWSADGAERKRLR